MGRYSKQIILSLVLFLFVSIDVNAESFSSTSIRFVYYYENGTKINTDFVSSTSLSLPQYSSSSVGPVSWRTYQWRYTSSSALAVNTKYRITTDFTFSSLDGDNVSINNFLSPTIGDIGCGTRYNNSLTTNLEIHEIKVSRISPTKFRVYYDFTPKVSTCSFFSGIFGYGPSDGDIFNSDYTINEYGTGNATVTVSTSYQNLSSTDDNTSNSDIIANQDKNTQDIIDNNNSNTEEIKDTLTDETPPDTTGLSDAAGWLPAGPVDSLITLPINLLQSLTNNLDSACTPINLPIPFVNDNLTLDCPATLLKRIDGFWVFWEGIGLIAGVWCLYKYFINLYKWVESHLSMDEKESLGKWGGA